MQEKVHAQAQGEHAQAGAGHARRKGPRKHNTRPQAQVIFQDKQAYNVASKGKVRECKCKACSHQGTCSASTQAMVLVVLPLLSLVMIQDAGPPPLS